MKEKLLVILWHLLQDPSKKRLIFCYAIKYPKQFSQLDKA